MYIIHMYKYINIYTHIGRSAGLFVSGMLGLFPKYLEQFLLKTIYII